MFSYVRKDMPTTPLTESGQKSTIRYRILLEKDGVLTEVSPWVKCTDYFNDVVIRTFCDEVFEAYGFKNNECVITGDLFMSIKDYCGKDRFRKNLTFINQWLANRGHTESITEVTTDVLDVPNDWLVLRVPRYYITNTAYISLVMTLIRSCSYGVELTKEGDMYDVEQKFQVIPSTYPVATIRNNFIRVFAPENKKILDDIVFFFCDPYNGKFHKKNIPEEYVYKHNAGWYSMCSEHAVKFMGI